MGVTFVNDFGFEAEDVYAELVTEGKHRNHYLFQRFKMEFHSKVRCSREFTRSFDL